MILVFTSTAFSDWVDEHVSQGGADSTFNPYLTFLFYCLCVSPSRVLSGPDADHGPTVLVSPPFVSCALRYT